MSKERWFSFTPDIHFEAANEEEAETVHKRIHEAIHEILGWGRAWSVLGDKGPKEVMEDE